jgi:drug/metabolite transporter (DMT)-like permease
MYIYYRAMHELPLTIFGMMAPIAPVTALIASHFILGSEISITGFLGICSIAIALCILLYKPSKNDTLKSTSIIFGILAYMLM